MSHFYGTLQGSRGQATRCGAKSGGLTTRAAGWGGCIRTHVWHDDKTGLDMYRVTMTPWHGSGGRERVIAEGILDATMVAKP